jgi:hypothetical protein
LPETGRGVQLRRCVLQWCVFRWCVLGLVTLATSLLAGGAGAEFPASYRGTPYHDDRHTSGSQKIPGKVQCVFYDLGGEGVAYHDQDAKNNGSGALNPKDGTYLNEFRMDDESCVFRFSRGSLKQELPLHVEVSGGPK